MTADDAHEESQGPATIGQRLLRAREAAGLSLADVASQTRIPIRHLQHIEAEEWDALPAPTYAVGFVRSYAGAIGLDGAELGRELRQQLGGAVRRAPAPEYYEPADPARVPPRALAIAAALIAIVLVVGYALWRSSLADGAGESRQEAQAQAPAEPAPTPAPPPVAPASLAGQPVTLTATDEVWLKITDGQTGPSLFQGTLQAGQSFAVPATARHPLLRTGRPQVLRASAGTRDLGMLDTSEHTVSNVSLLAQDIAARPAPAAPAPAPGTAPPPAIPVAPGAEPLNATTGF
jgi:hypothetical protein